jgi:hypothetical protein|tara:strand:- start:499 stop:732 length:234 start_codon:yes stop_codon:yes gene_type:complete
MNSVISQLKDWIKIITELGIGLVALGVLAEVIFGKGALFGASVVTNLSEIVAAIGGENGFVGLIAILLIFALVKNRS